MNAGIPLDEFESVLAKLRHAFITIPEENGLMFPANLVLAVRPNTIFFHQNKLLGAALADCRTLPRESTLKPTQCKELVMEWPTLVGIMDASGKGVGVWGDSWGEHRVCPNGL